MRSSMRRLPKTRWNSPATTDSASVTTVYKTIPTPATKRAIGEPRPVGLSGMHFQVADRGEGHEES